jgi:hypothetical protein
MRTTSCAAKAMAMLGVGLVAASSLTGCLPIGGCGVPDDPANVATFAATAKGSTTASARVDGIAATQGGVWILTTAEGTARMTEYDHLGGTRIGERSAALAPGATASGLAADGAALWFGENSATGVGRAWRIDPATEQLRSIGLPGQAHDLAWDGYSLIAVEGWASIDTIDPASGALLASVPVQRLASVYTVAYHDGETWIGHAGQPVLVYDAGGSLLATADIDLVATATGAVHMTFVGDDLVVASGTQIATYAIDRTLPTVTP